LKAEVISEKSLPQTNRRNGHTRPNNEGRLVGAQVKVDTVSAG